MVKAFLVILQTVMFLILYGLGSFLPVFTPLPTWEVHTSTNHVFVLDGLVLALLVYLVLLAVEAARRRLRGAGGLTTLSLVLALALGFAMKFGFKSI